MWPGMVLENGQSGVSQCCTIKFEFPPMPDWWKLTDLRKNLAMLRALPAWELRVLMRQMLALPMARLLVRWRGLRGAVGQLHGVRWTLPTGKMPPGMPTSQYAQRCAALTAIAARHGPVSGNCLPQALALQHLLVRQGIAAKIRIGVLPGSDPLDAHAWVELDGVPLGTEPPAGYQAIEALDVASWLDERAASSHT